MLSSILLYIVAVHDNVRVHVHVHVCAHVHTYMDVMYYSISRRSEEPSGGAQTDGTEAVVASSSSQAAKKGEGEVSSESVAIADPSHVWMDYISFSKAFS